MKFLNFYSNNKSNAQKNNFNVPINELLTDSETNPNIKI